MYRKGADVPHVKLPEAPGMYSRVSPTDEGVFFPSISHDSPMMARNATIEACNDRGVVGVVGVGLLALRAVGVVGG